MFKTIISLIETYRIINLFQMDPLTFFNTINYRAGNDISLLSHINMLYDVI
jgi:hypothetical protein